MDFTFPDTQLGRGPVLEGDPPEDTEVLGRAEEEGAGNTGVKKESGEGELPVPCSTHQTAWNPFISTVTIIH